MNKRAIIILSAIFLLIVGTLGFLLYTRKTDTSVTTNPTPTPTPTPQPVPTPEPTPTPPASTSNAPIKLVNDEVISPILFYKGDGISYFTSQGQLYQVDLKVTSGYPGVSNKRQIQLTPRAGISKVLWPSTGNNFIAEQNSGIRKTWAYYSGSKQVYVDLPTQITSLAWLPDATKIVYVWQGSNGNNSLNISNPDGTGYAKLADMYYSDSDIFVSPDGKNILFYRTTNQTDKNPITLVTSDGKIFKTVVKDGYNIGALWAPDSKRFVFTKRDPLTQNFNLWIGSILVDDARNLNLSGSIDKVLWSKDGKYLYVASSAATGGQTKESFWQVNTETFEKTEITSSVAINPKEMFLSISGDVLFFKNSNDGALYGLPLVLNSNNVNTNTTNTQSGTNNLTPP